MTKGELRQRVEAMGMLYAPQTELPPQIIDQYNEYAVRRIFRVLIRQREWEHRVSVVLNNGDPLPGDYIAYANRARKGTLQFADIPVNRIGESKYPIYTRATASHPRTLIADQKVYFLPDTTMIDPSTGNPFSAITGVTWFYYQAPPRIFGETIADSTDIGLPDFAGLWAVQVSFTYCLIHMMSAKKRAEYHKRLGEENLKSIQEFIGLARGLQEQTPGLERRERAAQRGAQS